MYHIIINGQEDSIRYIGSCVMANVCILNPPESRIIDSRIIPKVTSYEIVWATARRAPIKAYFEFDAQPDHRIEYTMKLDMEIKNSNPRFKSASECGSGRGSQIDNASRRASIGAMVNNMYEELVGWIGSLINSFSPSAIGCKMP